MIKMYLRRGRVGPEEILKAIDLRCSAPAFSICADSARSQQKGHVNKSRGQIYGQIAGVASFPRWQDLTVASPAKLSRYRCLISLAQGNGRNWLCPCVSALAPLCLCLSIALSNLSPSITLTRL